MLRVSPARSGATLTGERKASAGWQAVRSGNVSTSCSSGGGGFLTHRSVQQLQPLAHLAGCLQRRKFMSTSRSCSFWDRLMLTLTAMNAPHRLTPEAHMLLITSTECRAIAEKKLAEAG